MIYRFGGYRIDTERFELKEGDQLLQAEPQVIELLVFLLENRDRMVTKEEIYDQIWKGRVVSESALSSRIKMARQLIGDNGKQQACIRTVHRKGFRFVADVVVEGDATEEAASQATAITPANKPAIAVLPFNNLSNDQEQEYFSDGITADIIAHLARHRWLDVTARNTSFGYKGKLINVRQLGKELEVDYIVEGSVQRVGDRVRITVSLVDTQTGSQKWSERYSREIVDIFDLQDEITETIVARLEPEIGFAERNKVVMQRPGNLQAWDCYHLGIHHFFKFTSEDNELAQQMLLKSQKLDPHFGEAFSWWAYAAILGMVYWNTEPTEALLDAALEACNKALQLDSQNASFYALKARVLLARKEYDQAIIENEMAISLNPTLAAAYCGLGDSLAYEGRYEDSLRYFDKAIALSPNDPQLWAFYTYGALALLFDQEFEKVLEWTSKASSIPNCQYWTLAHRLVALAYLDRQSEMEDVKKKLLKENPKFSKTFAEEKLFYLKKQEQLELYLKGMEMAGV